MANSNNKKKPALSPAAAKVLEQYRSAGQPKPGAASTAGAGDDGTGAKPATPAAPPPATRLPKAAGRGK